MDTNEKLNLPNSHLDHIGVAVRDVQNTVKLYRILGIEPRGSELVEDQGIEVTMIQVSDSTRIELLKPVRDDSPVAKFIEKRGEGLHHIAMAVKDIYSALESCRRNGFQLIDEKPRIGAGGCLIAFLHPKSTGGILMELTQHKSEE